MMPDLHASTYQKHVEFEHEFRNRLLQYSAFIRENVLAKDHPAPERLYIQIKFEQDTGGAAYWLINTWGADTPDVTTKGRVFIDVVYEHIRRVGTQKDMNALPSRLPAPTEETLCDND